MIPKHLNRTCFHIWNPPLPYKREGLGLWNYPKKEGSSEFSHKKGGVGKIEGCSKKEGYH